MQKKENSDEKVLFVTNDRNAKKDFSFS